MIFCFLTFDVVFWGHFERFWAMLSLMGFTLSLKYVFFMFEVNYNDICVHSQEIKLSNFECNEKKQYPMILVHLAFKSQKNHFSY